MFPQFFSRKILASGESADDFREVTADERAKMEAEREAWVRPPQSFIDQWVAAGGIWNEATGYFELNGITDISYPEAMKIWSLSHRGIKESWNRVYGYGNGLHESMKPRMFARTYFTLLSAGYQNLLGFKEVFLGNEIVEAVDIAGGYSPGGIQIGLNSTFNGCKNLRKVSFGGGKGDAVIYVNSAAFAGCVNLERIDVFKFPMDDQTLDLSMAPRFEVDCIEKTVAALFTSSHNTIILHPDVFAKCSPELLAAAEAKFLTITTP